MPRFTLTTEGAVTRLQFDDGGMNLLSSEALRELRAAVAALSAPSSGAGEGHATALLLFTSSRPRLFAAGADMAEMQRFSAREAEEFARLGQSAFEEIARVPAITVAMIDGDCFGGALDLALAFDLRFATPRSRFSHPGARLGIVTGFGGTSRWRTLLTRPAANQLFLANRTLTAQDALEIGLVDRVADSHDDVLEELGRLDGGEAQMVKQLTNCSPSLSRDELVLLARRLGTIYCG